MIDPLKDPEQNYTVPPNQPAGMRIPEFAIRQLIGHALGKIRDSIDTPKNLVDTLFAMVPDEVRKQIKQWIREHKNMFLDVSWPRESGFLPMIVVEPQGEQEETSSVLLGDYAGDMPFGRFEDGRPSASPQYAIPERHTTNIYVGADDDRLTLFLYQIVKFILLSNKDSLTKWYDIHALSMSGQILTQEDKQLPQHGYYRVLSLSYFCMFDFNGTEEAAKIVSMELDVDALSGGTTITSQVPFDP